MKKTTVDKIDKLLLAGFFIFVFISPLFATEDYKAYYKVVAYPVFFWLPALPFVLFPKLFDRVFKDIGLTFLFFIASIIYFCIIRIPFHY